jgi:hypothetical protein
MCPPHYDLCIHHDSSPHGLWMFNSRLAFGECQHWRHYSTLEFIFKQKKFIFPLFPSSSQWVCIRFAICSLCSQCVPPRVFPIGPHFNPIHMLCQKSSASHLYRWAKGGDTPPSNLGSLHSLNFFFFLKKKNFVFFVIGQSNWFIAKEKKVGLLRHPQLINKKQNR